MMNNLTSSNSAQFDDHRDLNYPQTTPPPAILSVNQSSPPSPSSPPPPSSQNNVLGITIGACAAAGILIAAVVLLYLLWVRKRGKKNINTFGNFSFKEISSATEGFSSNHVIGTGGFGVVYKGLLPNQMKVAIKRLKPGSSQGELEFQNEVQIGSRLHHQNIVKFIGSCVYGVERVLVYELVENETLEFHLRRKNGSTLDWQKRLNIALGCAKALNYMHEECSPIIIHRDIKSANVLLDDSFEPKLTDFGLSKENPSNDTHVSTYAKGTFGYLDPIYFWSNQLRLASDIYSFGILLLEIITGKSPHESSNNNTNETYLDWAKNQLHEGIKNDGNFDQLVDPCLQGTYNPKVLTKMAICVLSCIQDCSKKRPKISRILQVLQEEVSITDLQEEMLNPNGNSFNILHYMPSISFKELFMSLSNKKSTDISNSIPSKAEDMV